MERTLSTKKKPFTVPSEYMLHWVDRYRKLGYPGYYVSGAPEWASIEIVIMLSQTQTQIAALRQEVQAMHEAAKGKGTEGKEDREN